MVGRVNPGNDGIWAGPGAVLQARFQHDKLIDYIERERLRPLQTARAGAWTNRLADVAHFRHQIDFVRLQQRTVFGDVKRRLPAILLNSTASIRHKASCVALPSRTALSRSKVITLFVNPANFS